MTEGALLVLVHSPLVGPYTWSAVASALRAAGRAVVVPDLTTVPRSSVEAYADAVEGAAPRAEAMVLHSGAGSLAPAIAERLPGIRHALFVDALLPHPGRSWFDTAPPALAAHLRELAGTDGRLPAWDQWFPPGSLDALLPDPELRAKLVAELPRLPIDYFEQPAPHTPWTVDSAYLQLSAAYDEQAAEAAALGWPVERLELHHLALLTDPETIAARIAAR